VALRVCTIAVPRFCHDGLEVDGAWREFDFKKAPKSAQQAFLDYAGHFVQVHPDDLGELAKLGLEQFEESGRRRVRVMSKKT
jgi:hypothetical protein